MLMRTRNASWFSHVLTLVIGFGLLFPFAPTAFAAEQREQFASQLEIFREIRASLHDIEFMGEELSFELAFEDPETLLEYVTDRIAFESYYGILRSIDGTLASRAGNAFDQSMLLAYLLNSAGYEVQIATATLSDDDATRLLSRLGETPAVAQQLGDVSESTTEALLASYGLTVDQLTGIDFDLTHSEAYATATQVQAAFAGYLGAAPDINAELLAEAKAYAFVQYRLSSNQDWSDLHPAFGTLEAPKVEVEEVLTGSIPDQFQQTLAIDVLIERKVDEDLELIPVTNTWSRPIANMLGIPVEISIVPMDAIEISETSTGGYNEADFFIVQINQFPDSTALAFDMMGATLAPDVAADPAAGFFQTLGGVMNEATGLFGTVGSDKEAVDPLALTGVVVRYTYTVPGKEPVVYERYVYDRLTAENRASGTQLLTIEAEDMPHGLVQQHIILVNPGWFSDAYVEYQMTDIALENLEALALIAELEERYEDAGKEMPVSETLEIMGKAGRLAHWQLLASFDTLPIANDTLSYRSEPLIVSAGTVTGANEGDNPLFVVDIVHNHRRVLNQTASGFAVDQATTMLYGAWETALEKHYAESVFGSEATNASNMFADGTPTFQALSGDSADLSAVPAEFRRAVQGDLTLGYTVLFPTSAADDGHWWRLDTATGELLGIGSNGAGQAMVEYLAELAGIVSPIINVLSALNGVAGCVTGALDGKDPNACMKRQVIGTAMMMGIGWGIGHAFGDVIGKIGVFLVIDVPTLITTN